MYTYLLSYKLYSKHKQEGGVLTEKLLDGSMGGTTLFSFSSHTTKTSISTNSAGAIVGKEGLAELGQQLLD